MSIPPAIIPLGDEHRAWANAHLTERWGATAIVSRGIVHDGAQLPGFVAVQGNTPVGLALYHLDIPNCELVSLDSTIQGAGIGTALIEAIRHAARAGSARRVWLITTNDNLDALRFYQRRGFVLVTIYRDAVIAARKLKPQIPPIGDYGIPIRDEIELELPIRADE